MTETATTTERLVITPPPDNCNQGPVTVMLDPKDGEPADALKTFPDLAGAKEFADTCVERGFLKGELSFQPADTGPTALEQTVDEEQAAHDTAAAQPEPETAAEKPKRTRTPKPNKDLEASCSVVYIGKTGTEKVDYAGPETKAREKFTATPTPGVGRMELRGATGEILEVKEPHLTEVGSSSAAVEVLNMEDVPASLKAAAADALAAEPEHDTPAESAPPQEDVAGDTPEGDPPALAAPEGPEEPTGQKTLIDRSSYTDEKLQLPLIDGQQIDRIAFAFTGQIMLDRSDPADVALWRKLQLGHDVTLQIEGSCAGYQGKQNTNRDGDLDVVVGVRRIKVHTIYMPVLDEDEGSVMGTTDDPTDPRLGRGVDDEPIPQHDVYLVLSDEERAKGFVRPLRTAYVHAEHLGGCGAVTTMNRAIAETYARQPSFYGATYCCTCRKHLPVGADGEFVWDGTTEKVGT